MALKDEVKQALKEAGEVFKKELWKSEDEAFLDSRAADLIGLNHKAAATTNPDRKRAYQAAARDTLQSVKMLALIRAEVVVAHLVDLLGRIFMEKVLPRLIQLIPVVIAAI